MSTEQLAEGGVRARENGVSPGGISSVVLGYSCLDGGAARVGVGKVRRQTHGMQRRNI